MFERIGTVAAVIALSLAGAPAARAVPGNLYCDDTPSSRYGSVTWTACIQFYDGEPYPMEGIGRIKFFNTDPSKWVSCQARVYLYWYDNLMEYREADCLPAAKVGSYQAPFVGKYRTSRWSQSGTNSWELCVSWSGQYAANFVGAHELSCVGVDTLSFDTGPAQSPLPPLDTVETDVLSL